MLTFENLIRIVIIVFLELVIAFDHIYANSRSCYNIDTERICYFQPNDVIMTWEEAWEACKQNTATLPVIENRTMEETLKKYLNSNTSLEVNTWLAGREIRKDEWQWLNGQLFGEQSILKEQVRSVEYETNAFIKDLKFYLGIPKHNKYYICHYNDRERCHKQSIIPWKNGCLSVRNDERLNLFDARNRCLDEGGDLATFEEDENLDLLKQQNSSLLRKNREYWIGLHRTYWIWNETNSSKEIKYSNCNINEYVLNQECLYISPINYKWYQDRCTAKKRVLCQTASVTLFPEQHPTSSKETSIAIIVGSILAVVVVVVIIVAVVVLSKMLRKSKAKQLQKNATRVQTDGLYEDLHRGQDNPAINDQYAELGEAAPQQTEMKADYQNVSDYDDVEVTRSSNLDYIEVVE